MTRRPPDLTFIAGRKTLRAGARRHVVILGALFLAFGVVLLGPSGEADGSAKGIALDCKVQDGAAFLASNFESQFCRELASRLQQGLQRPVSLGAASPGQLAVTVRLRAVSATTGEVTLSRSDRDGSVTSQLSSLDRNLSAGAAGTLVRPIARLLDLAK